MDLIQILLPVVDPRSNQPASRQHQEVQTELTELFDGLACYSRSPAERRWKDQGETVRDGIIVCEIMTGKVDSHWWKTYRFRLEKKHTKSPSPFDVMRSIFYKRIAMYLNHTS